MKKIISLVTILTSCTTTLVPVMLLQTSPVRNNSKFSLKSKTTGHAWYVFNNSYYNRNLAGAASADYVSDGYKNFPPPVASCSGSYYHVYITPLGAKLMGLFTTHGPEKHHPASNFMWGLNTHAPGFGTHTDQPGDYLVGIGDGMDHHLVADSSIISDFEEIIGGSIGSEIEAYLKAKTTDNLEISFQYNGYDNSHPNANGYYVNASWPH